MYPICCFFGSQVQKRYGYVTKEQENPLKSVSVFKLGIKKNSTCLPLDIEIVPPFYNSTA
jgi:hypothetical protein